MSTAPNPQRPGPLKQRILAPDVARGLVLLGIAIANINTAWLIFRPGETAMGMAFLAPQNVADQIVGVFNSTFIHMRGLPMFTALFGYGIGMLLAREAARNTPFEAARKLIRRRYLWLALFGAAHAILLFFGDIILTYSLVGLFITLTMLRASDKALKRVAGILFGICGTVAILGIIGEVYVHAAHPEVVSNVMAWMQFDAGAGGFDFFGTYLGPVLMGLMIVVFSPFMALFFFLIYGPLMVLGFLAGRRQLLSDVPGHRTLLRRVAYIGFGLSIPGGLIAGLMKSELIFTDTPWLLAPDLLGWITGAFGGLATIALIALLVQPLQEKIAGGDASLPLPVAALQALGQRSLSGYLFQSVVFISLLPPFTLGLMQHLTITTATLLATGVWLLSVIGAYLLARGGMPGPAEAVHRRLTYRKRPAQERSR